MISFWTPAGNGAVRVYSSNRGLPIADRFQPRTYDEIADPTELSLGPQLFAALDQLSPVQRIVVGHLWDAHARRAPQEIRLNDPRRALLRFDLLRQLKAAGLNGFSVYRHDEIDAIERFPVFVREIRAHNGPKTGLLHSHDEVRQAVRALRMRGRLRENLMIVEYADASGADGLFRKYAAFRVGTRIIPCHVFASSSWCVKSHQNQPSDASLRMDLAYVQDHPHAAWLERVFEVGGIDYGRIDYGVANGQPQAWEINLNPTIGREPGRSRHTHLPTELKQLRNGTRELFHDRLRAAFVALDDTASGSFDVPLGEKLRATLAADGAGRRRRERFRRWAKALYESPTIGRPVRRVYSLFPRR